uniref:Uncharacterized protein n=1 Tax=viral metagenome TaxID=1070528 RepID=A0A6C0C8J9_9ZZZZ
MIYDISMLTNLTRLEIAGCKYVTDASIRHLTKMTRILISNVRQITCNSLRHLPNLTRLTALHFEYNFDFSKLTNLRTLKIIYNTDTASSIRYLTNLTSLSLFSVLNITEDHIRPLTNLRKLNIKYCNKHQRR